MPRRREASHPCPGTPDEGERRAGIGRASAAAYRAVVVTIETANGTDSEESVQQLLEDLLAKYDTSRWAGGGLPERESDVDFPSRRGG
jgi:hypothetical protein